MVLTAPHVTDSRTVVPRSKRPQPELTGGTVLGRGTSSTILLSIHRGGPCALKHADKKENSRRYIRHEVDMLKKLSECMHVVRMLKYKVSRTGYIKYERLTTCLFDAIPFETTQKALEVYEQLCTALTEIHQLGIVHCDIKPENIMLDESGVLKLIDFGNAMTLEELRTGKAYGTIHYYSPARLLGMPLGASIDRWAAGCIFFEMVTGHTLFTPRRDGSMSKEAHLIKMIRSVFGERFDTMAQRCPKAHKFYDKSGTFLYEYMADRGRPERNYAAVISALEKKGCDRAMAQQVMDDLMANAF